MEVFLLVVLVVLIFVFNSGRKSQLEQLFSGLKELKKDLKNQEARLLELKNWIENNSIKTSSEVLKEPEIPKEEIAVDVIEEPTHIYQEETYQQVIYHHEVEKPKPEYTKPTPTSPTTKTWWTNFKEENPDIEKFIGENIINKIGIAILVIGIGYFVKFAIDQNWINEIARVGIGILCGSIVLAIAHRLKNKFSAFSSVLVAGAMAIFYITIAIGFHDYKIFSQTVAFVIMVVITAFSVLLSILYDRKELAALSLIGGFAVPFMLSTGSGNYVVLFSYILILDAGMLVLAYIKNWRIIKLLSYLLSTVLFASWLVLEISSKAQPPFLGAFVFATAFYFIFILMNIAHKLKLKKNFDTQDLLILISNTFLYFTYGMLIFKEYHPELKGLFTLVLALINFLFSWFLYKKFIADKILVFLLIALTLTFITLSIPIQLQGNYITLFWAAEAVVLMWLALQIKMNHLKVFSVIISLLMVISLLMDWGAWLHSSKEFSIVLNPLFITSLVSAASFIGINFLLKKNQQISSFPWFDFNPIQYSKILNVLTVLILYGTGFLELNYQLFQYDLSYSVIAAVIGAYHFIYSGIILLLLLKAATLENNTRAIVLFFANVMLFVTFVSSFPLDGIQYQHFKGSSESVAGLSFHYVSLAVLIVSAFLMYKKSNFKTTFFGQYSREFNWVISLLIIYSASKELITLGLFNFMPLDKIAIGTSLELYNHYLGQIVKIGFPVLWGIIAFSFLAYGIKKQNKVFRIISLVLLVITVIKLFVFDIRKASEGGKIIAFILLGIVVLLMSFMYQKIKAVIFDNKAPENEA